MILAMYGSVDKTLNSIASNDVSNNWPPKCVDVKGWIENPAYKDAMYDVKVEQPELINIKPSPNESK